MTQYGVVTKDYSGKWCPLLSFGIITGCFKIPKTDEKRIKIKTGQKIATTRAWNDHWWYGQICDVIPETKGWFPAKCLQLENSCTTGTYPENKKDS